MHKNFGKRIVLLAVFNIAILLSFLPASVVLGPTQVGVIYSCPSPDPVVDGYIGGTEWAASPTSVKITLYNLANQGDTIEIRLKSVYSAENLLYIAGVIPNGATLGNEHLIIVFRTNLVDDLISGGVTTGFRYAQENDAKVLWFHNNHSVDAYTLGDGLTWDQDPANGGVEDSYGKCRLEGGEIIFELRFPLNSGDANGFDPQLFPNGTTIDIFTYYYDANTAKTYSQIRIIDNDFDYNIIKIGPCGTTTSTTNISLIAFIISLITGTAVYVLIRRKRK